MAPQSTPPKARSKPAWITPRSSTTHVPETTPPRKPVKKVTPSNSSLATPMIRRPDSSPASPKSKATWSPPGSSNAVVNGIEWGNKAGRRARSIRFQLSEFERGVSQGKYRSKWLTAKDVALIQEQLGSEEIPSLWQDVDPSSLELSTLSVPLQEGGVRLEVFTLFRELPTELRLLIWNFAARMPKFIEMRYFAVNCSWPYIRCSNLGNLSMICRESREIAKSVEGLEGSATIGMNRRNKKLDKKFLRLPYNPERDTIFFRPLHVRNVDFHMWKDFSQLQTIQHIAIPLDLGPRQDPLEMFSEPIWRTMLEKCQNVKSITFVLGCGEVSWKIWRTVEARRIINSDYHVIGWRKGLEWRRRRINVADLRGEAAAWRIDRWWMMWEAL